MRLVACRSCHTQYDVSNLSAKTLTCHCGVEVENVDHAAVDAKIQRCGSCGASVSDDAESCDYCAGAIVRDKRLLELICPECYARNTQASKYCTSCGVEFHAHSIEFDGEPLHCPHDPEEEMNPRSIGGMVVHECPECAGVWVPEERFDALVKKAIESQQMQASTGILGSARPGPKAQKIMGKVVYRKCPDCGGVMQRKNFGGRSGIIVDWCGHHGTWLDADELEGIAGYISSGGMTAPSPVTESGNHSVPFGGDLQTRKAFERRQVVGGHSESERGTTIGNFLSSLLDW